MVVLLATMAYPTVLALVMSVSKIEFPSFTLRPEGLAAFERVLSQPTFLVVVRNSLVWTFGATAGEFLVGLTLALLLNKDRPGMAVFRIILFLPWTVPIVVVALNWLVLYNADFGFFGYYLSRLVKGTAGPLGDPSMALPALIVTFVWHGYPFAMVMLLAGLRTVPDSLYDAGRVDGASGWQMLRYITLPWIRPVMAIVLILLTVDALNAFTTVNIMTGGGPANTTQIFAQYIYLQGFRSLRFNDAAAVSVIVLFIAGGFTALYLRFIHSREMWEDRV